MFITQVISIIFVLLLSFKFGKISQLLVARYQSSSISIEKELQRTFIKSKRPIPKNFFNKNYKLSGNIYNE